MIAESAVAQVVPDRRRRLLILAVCSSSLLIVSLDQTIVNVALPSIHRSFDSSVAALQWIVDAYTVVGAGLLMLSASTGDRIGRRRMFQIGLSVFAMGSLLCSIAPSTGVLIAARALQAVGGSMLNPMALSVIRNVFVRPQERAVALGAWGAVPGISMASGPLVGGALIVAFSWRAVFLINLPICLVALVLSQLVMPESRAPHPRRLDPIGQLLIALALATLIFAIINAPHAGWTSTQTVLIGSASLVLWIAMVCYELHRREPVLEIRAFRSAPLSGASTSAIAAYTVFSGFLFLNTLYLQGTRGLSPLGAGLRLLPFALATMIGAPVSGRIVGRYGTRLSLVAGGLAILVSGLLLTRLTAHTPYSYLAFTYALLGGGIATVNPPITNTAVSGLPPSMAGVAAAITSTSRQTGQAIGVAVLGALAGADVEGAIGPGFPEATHISWWIVACLGGLVALIGWLSTTPWARETARQAADQLSRTEQPGA